MITCTRHHDISVGHRVVGAGKCSFFHGHNYRVHFTCSAEELDESGMVVDFSFMKDRFSRWLEIHWDHKFLMWNEDPLSHMERQSIGLYLVTFNPTAENMASFLLRRHWMLPRGVSLIRVMVEETRKCSAEATL